ncbi:MAG: hypothetical protein AA931_12725 [Peptococcaceae bacterium 1109]|nr:MAG: hypothetical protein AA931_12725 [Peptococcaceae bacterium 1109]
MRCHYPSVRLERGVVNNVDGLGEAGRAAFPMYGTDVGTSEPVEERTKRYPVKRKKHPHRRLSGNGGRSQRDYWGTSCPPVVTTIWCFLGLDD